MEIRYEKHWSGYLNRDMEFKIYGSCGKPVLFIPCQAGRFWDFESFHMVDYWAPWIESGKCMVFAIDTIDNEAWAAIGADNRWRIEITIICRDQFVKPAIKAIMDAARTGEVGDGRIFVSPVDDTYSIRTGEKSV